MQDENLEHEDVIERGPPALGAVGSWHRLLQIRPEQLEVDDRAQPFEMVALGRKVLQALVNIEEPGLAPHPTLPFATPARQSRTPLKDELLGGLQGAECDKPCLTKDRDALLAFYDVPAEHWDDLRTSNLIESAFATVRHRTVRTKGALLPTTARLMVFKLVVAASKTWRLPFTRRSTHLHLGTQPAALSHCWL